MKLGKFEANGFGILAVVVIALGALSVIDDGVKAVASWRRTRGLEKIARTLDCMQDSVEATPQQVSNGYAPVQNPEPSES
jgi:hypothetical protein